VVAAGKQADGTLIVVDRTGSGENHVFVSQPGALVRQRVIGSGSGNDAAGMWLQFALGTTDMPWSLRVELPAGAAPRMGVVRGPLDSKTFVIGEKGEVLTIVGPEAYAGLAVRNLPGDVYVEYLGTVEDGRRLVVTRPADDFRYEDFRLFLSLGAPDHLVERMVIEVSRARDGGTTDIRFDLDGAVAVAHFPAPQLGGGATLTAGGRTLTITTQPPGTRPEGVAFFCR
jgi:hypothetical protein